MEVNLSSFDTLTADELGRHNIVKVVLDRSKKYSSAREAAFITP